MSFVRLTLTHHQRRIGMQLRRLVHAVLGATLWYLMPKTAPTPELLGFESSKWDVVIRLNIGVVTTLVRDNEVWIGRMFQGSIEEHSHSTLAAAVIDATAGQDG